MIEQVQLPPARTGAASVRHVVPLDRTAQRFLRNGRQSWSPTDVAVVGEAVDPSLDGDHPTLLRWWHHSDPSPAVAGELRSELFTVVDGEVWGALGADRNDTTFRLQAGGTELVVEAWLGGAVVRAGEERVLHDVGRFSSVAEWADAFGAAAGARTNASFQVGWCSWYQFFHDVTEDDIRRNLVLAASGGWPYDVFQVDDGFQSEIGDWLTTNDKFPTPVDGLAAAIAAEGYTPGIWLAPFVVSPRSAVAREHPGWVVEHKPGRPLVGNVNPGWGGEVSVLDTTNPEVLDHLEGLGRDLRAAGYPYLKLDFTYAPALPGLYSDASRTPAERVRAGYDAIRRGAGDDAFLLACGAPLGPVAGVVDGCRIGPDVAPSWELEGPAISPGYADTQPSTKAAWRSTVLRQPLHRRLWLNDPDCVLLRSDGTGIPEPYRTTWAHAVAASGGMVLQSDDLARCTPADRRLLDEVVAAGRAADDVLRAGP